MVPFPVDLTVYPDECDTFGHLNQASFLSLFERARWEMLARGPGMDLFTRSGAWPAVRKTTIEYHAPAFPGDVLRFTQILLHRGRTSFTMRQVAQRTRDEIIIASAEFIFVCLGRDGKPVEVPGGLDVLMESNPASPRAPRRRVNGVNLALTDVGEGPCILFIHGYPLNRSIWDAQIQGLRGWRRVAPDLRGSGQSDAPDLGYSMATYADDLLALLDALDIRRAVVCGLSMGGYIAFELLRNHRERVAGLILMATRAEADSPEARKARDQAVLLARDKGAAAIADSMLPRMLAPPSLLEPALVVRLRQIMEETPVPGVVGALTAMRERADSTSLLATLTGLPTLIVAGELDQLIPLADTTRLHDAMPHSGLRVIPNAGHLPPIEQPTLVTQALQEFLDSLAGETGPPVGA